MWAYLSSWGFTAPDVQSSSLLLSHIPASSCTTVGSYRWPFSAVFVSGVVSASFTHLFCWFETASLQEDFHFQEQAVFYIWRVGRLWKHSDAAFGQILLYQKDKLVAVIVKLQVCMFPELRALLILYFSCWDISQTDNSILITSSCWPSFPQILIQWLLALLKT
jgi:hypothetical protein